MSSSAGEGGHTAEASAICPNSTEVSGQCPAGSHVVVGGAVVGASAAGRARSCREDSGGRRGVCGRWGGPVDSVAVGEAVVES